MGQLVRQVYSHLGLKGAFLYLLYRFLPLPSVTVRLRHRNAGQPVWCRMGTTDIGVFRLVFSRREYSCLDDVQNPQLILDCGANVGYSSVYFLSHFPNAKVIAIEPDPENFRMLKKNLAPFEGRYEAIQAAIWCRTTRMAICQADVTRADSVRVAEAADNDRSGVSGVTIDDVLAGHRGKVSILKMDIEGAETQVFVPSCKSWLGRVENIAIELHGDEAREVFGAAMEGENFSISQYGELTVCKR